VAKARSAPKPQPLLSTSVNPPKIPPTVEAPPLETPADPNVALTESIEEIARERDRITSELKPRRQELAAAADRLSAAKTQLETLNASLDDYQRLQSEDAKSQSELEATQAHGAIQAGELRRRLRLLQQQQASASSKYAFIAYEGHSGTTRRPIFIECTEKGLRFLPENVVVTAADLEGFSRASNPLLSGAESLVKYWSVRNRLSTEPEVEPAPYVLFLVRPDGCVAFYAAREMLSRMKIPTGYELIDQDWQLALPDAEPEAVAICRQAVSDALAQRSQAPESLLADSGPNTEDIPFRRGAQGSLGSDKVAGGLPVAGSPLQKTPRGKDPAPVNSGGGALSRE
ncbi:MAG: hypothetical protein WD648_06365, partial [Planctomycetaceae bacterium]